MQTINLLRKNNNKDNIKCKKRAASFYCLLEGSKLGLYFGGGGGGPLISSPVEDKRFFVGSLQDVDELDRTDHRSSRDLARPTCHTDQETLAFVLM